MIARAESWSRPANGAWPLVAAVGVCLFLASWWVLHQGFYQRDQIVDLPVYEKYGEWMTQGKVPYRDFSVEYPPAALPVFVLPALGDGDSETYRRRFEGSMAAFGAITIVCVALALAALGAGMARMAAAVGFVAVAPLLLGSVVLSRFDASPALVVVPGRFLLGRRGAGSLGRKSACAGAGQPEGPHASRASAGGSDRNTVRRIVDHAFPAYTTRAGRARVKY